MSSDNLMLNDDKTEFLIIGTRQQLAKVNINCIRVGSTDVCPVTVARKVGSWFDEQLTIRGTQRQFSGKYLFGRRFEN